MRLTIMKQFIKPTLAFVLIGILSLAILMACVPVHQIEFKNDACIIPYERYQYHTCANMNILIDGDLYVVPRHFTTDLASVPRIFWTFIAPQYSGFVAPSILHDYLYSCGNLGTRSWADSVLYSALMTEGVSRYTSIKFYIAVRLFGGKHFDENNRECKRIKNAHSNT